MTARRRTNRNRALSAQVPRGLGSAEHRGRGRRAASRESRVAVSSPGSAGDVFFGRGRRSGEMYDFWLFLFFSLLFFLLLLFFASWIGMDEAMTGFFLVVHCGELAWVGVCQKG